MKTTTFALTSVALGMMAGITAMHHHQVGEMVRKNSTIAPQAAAPGSAIVQTAQPAPQLVASDVAAQPQPVPGSAAMPPRGEREDALLELLSEMRKEQKRLRAQLAETNREMSELTFRVDTHSDSFKPLRIDPDRPRRLENVTPQVPQGSAESLLPPVPGGLRQR